MARTKAVYLVVQGWSQVPGIDRGGTFAPICRIQSIRMTAELHYEVFMLDAQTAFLNADVEEDVFAKMAPGHEIADESGVPLVMKLKKSWTRATLDRGSASTFSPEIPHFGSLRSLPKTDLEKNKIATTG